MFRPGGPGTAVSCFGELEVLEVQGQLDWCLFADIADRLATPISGDAVVQSDGDKWDEGSKAMLGGSWQERSGVAKEARGARESNRIIVIEPPI